MLVAAERDFTTTALFEYLNLLLQDIGQKGEGRHGPSSCITYYTVSSILQTFSQNLINTILK